MVSVVIPIFNEEGCLRELYRRLVGALQQCGVSYEIIFVDDGSRDSSPQLLKEFAAADFNVKALRLSRNFGHQAAITAGLDHARGSAVILMDGDLQDPPEVIPDFVEKWREGWDVVYAIKTRRKENIFKRFAFWLFYRLLGFMSDVTLPLDAGIFSLMDRRVVDWLKALPERNRYLAGLRVWVGFRQTGIEFERASRYDDRPRQTLGRLMKLALDGVFSFSQFPIHIISWLGALVSAFTLVAALVIVSIKLFTGLAIAGWASIMTAVFFLGGVQLITIGVIGEYVGRIYDEIKQRPLYIVAETIDSSAKKEARHTL